MSGTRYTCSSSLALDMSSTDPFVGTVTCQLRPVGVSTSHGDRLRVVVSATAGGYVSYLDRDAGVTRSRTFTTASGATFSRVSHEIRVDSRAPQPCSASLALRTTSARITQQPSVQLDSQGWYDSDSGLDALVWEVFPMVHITSGSSYVLRENMGARIATGTLSTNAGSTPCGSSYSARSTISFSLSDRPAGVYSILLTASDRAGTAPLTNHAIARRLVLYLPNAPIGEAGSVSISAPLYTAPDNERYVNTATSAIYLRWPGVFYNAQFRTSRHWFVPISYAYSPYSAALDQTSGDLPISGTPTDMGIVSFQLALSNTSASSTTLGGSTTQYTLGSTASMQGKNVRAVVTATDLLGQTRAQTIEFGVDTTAPAIANLRMLNAEGSPTAVHSSTDLTTMDVDFTALDGESGLLEVHWTLSASDSMQGPDVIAQASMPVVHRTPATCTTACACASLGRCQVTAFDIPLASHPAVHQVEALHSADYYIFVRAKNRAGLESVAKLRIVVDLSPPLPGRVVDAPPGHADVGFTAATAIKVHWTGFVDHETGVRSYYVLVGPACYSTFDTSFKAKAVATAQTSYTFTVSDPGRAATFFTTVVALNGALSPSQPVCSSGITYDPTAPLLANVSLDVHTRMHPGLVTVDGDPARDTWLIQADGSRLAITPACAASVAVTAVPAATLALFPLANATALPAAVACSDFQALPTLARARSTDDPVLALSWAAADAESGLRHVVVSVASSAAPGADNLHPAVVVAHASDIVLHSVALAQDVPMYVHLRAVNQAGQSTSAVIGPIVIDATPPVVNDRLISLDGREDTEQLVVEWDMRAFVDPDDQHPLSRFAVSVGSQDGTHDVAQANTTCVQRLADRYRCAVPVASTLSSAQLQQDHTYWATVTVFNTAGLSTTSAPRLYTHQTRAPRVSDLKQVLAARGPRSPGLAAAALDASLLIAWANPECQRANLTLSIQNGAAVSSQPVALAACPTTAAFKPQQTGLYTINLTATNTHGTTVLTSRLQVFDPATQPSFAVQMPAFVASKTVSVSWSRPAQVGDAVAYDVTVTDAQRNAVANLGRVAPDNAATTTFVWEGSATLVSQQTYRFAVSVCTPGGCYAPVFSQPWTVADVPPRAGAATGVVTFGPDSAFAAQSHLTVTLQPPFQDGTVDASSMVNKYTLMVVDMDGVPLLDKWLDFARNPSTWTSQRVVLMLDAQTFPDAAAHLRALQAASARGLRAVVRGFGPSGLHTDLLTAPLGSAGNTTQASPVLDVLPDRLTSTQDLAATASSQLAAAWPGLASVGPFQWSVSRDVPVFGTCAASSPAQVLVCGQSAASQAFTQPLALTQGATYYFCIKPVTGGPVCTDGVLFAPDPPVPGLVDFDGDARFHAIGSQLGLRWEPFGGQMATYEVGLGLRPGADDLVPFVTLHGAPTGAMVSNLTLRSGQRYYASVRGTTTAGLSATGSSPEPILVDTSPPLAGHVSFSNTDSGAGLAYSLSSTTLTASWSGFQDPESGIARFELAIGTGPCQADVAPFEPVGLATTATRTQLTLVDGMQYYACLRAVNNAGLSATIASSAVVVDTSAPLPGTKRNGDGGGDDDDDDDDDDDEKRAH